MVYSPTKMIEVISEDGEIKLTPDKALLPEDPEYQNLLSRFFKQVIRQQKDMVTVGAKAQKLFSA